MSNPVLGGKSSIFGSPQNAAAIAKTSSATIEHDHLEELYSSPAAGPVQTGRMTYDDVVVRTSLTLGVVIAAAAATWVLAPQLYMVGLIVGFVLGLVNSFKREPSPALILAYAAAEGVFLGGISAIFEQTMPGIAMQAVLATMATFVAVLALYRSGKVQVTGRFRRIVMGAMLGYLLFSLVNFGLMLFTDIGGWGLRSEITIMGIPLGLIIGVAAVILASAFLMMDFDQIKNGVQQGIPAKYSWTAAFGLTVTLVWLYLEFLRIFAILRD